MKIRIQSGEKVQPVKTNRWNDAKSLFGIEINVEVLA